MSLRQDGRRKLDRVEFRATGLQKERWARAAKAQDRSLSSWICHACDAFADAQDEEDARRARKRPGKR